MVTAVPSLRAEQLERLKSAPDKALATSPATAHENANVKLYAALARLMLETIPQRPLTG